MNGGEFAAIASVYDIFHELRFCRYVRNGNNTINAVSVLLANDYNFDTKIIVRGNLGMNCQALYNGNYNNLLKFELHILMLGFQVSDHLFCYRLKSTTENNVLARARANDKRKTNPYLQVCISADKCARRFPH